MISDVQPVCLKFRFLRLMLLLVKKGLLHHLESDLFTNMSNSFKSLFEANTKVVVMYIN